MTQTRGTVRPRPERRASHKLAFAVAVLTLLTALFGVLSAYLGFQTAQLSKSEKEAQIAAQQNGAKADQLEGQNQDLQAENQDLRSQLGAPTASIRPGTAATERHSGTVNLAALGPGADLDAPKTDPQWGSTGNYSDFDLQYRGDSPYFASSGQVLNLDAEPADYETCRTSTGYVNGNQGSVATANIAAGTHFCVQTGENRYAAVKVLTIGTDKATFDVVTYDPPFKSS